MKGLKKAAELYRDLGHLELGKLSAESFLKEAMEAADCGPNRLDMLADIIQKPEHIALPRLVRIIRKNIFDGRISAVPPADRLAAIVRGWGGPEVSAQLNAIGSSEGDIFALAVREAGKRHPDIFGDVTDWAAHLSALEIVQEQYEAALAAMDFTAADLFISDKISFMCTLGTVTLGPNWQQRLVDWELAEPSKKAA